MNDERLSLFEVIHWGAISAQFERRVKPPSDALISNVTVVPFIGDHVVIIRLVDGSYQVPGGTREPNELYLDAARRELIEEAGAHLINFRLFGAWRCHSVAEKPYRPHLPHPDFYRLAGYGDVEFIGHPTNPPDGEQVTLVETVTVKDAEARFLASKRPDLADLVKLAAHLRKEQA